MNDSNLKHCPTCGTAFDAEGVSGCPRCLMLAALQPTHHAECADRPPPPSLAAVSAAFPQLEVLELIGQGGMGCVFKTRQPKLDRFVALKLLPASLAERDPAFAGRFEREGQLLARLHHPNIVTVHDSGTAGGFFYLLMEYVDGVNLRQAMRTRKFTPQQALGIVPRICDALQYAHDEGVLHRDIKPENILLDAKGRVKLADFGIAKLMGEAEPATSAAVEGTPGFTQPGTALGTPSYMAPEQRETPAEVDHRADIYSLGVVLYELLTGELPAGAFTPPSARSEADPRVDAIVKQALEKERERRQHSAAEVRTQVEALPPTGSQPKSVAHSPHSIQPTLILHTGFFALLAVLFFFVVPRFAEIFREMGLAQPAMTKFGRPVTLISLLLFPVLLGLDVGLCFLSRRLGGRRGLRLWSICFGLAVVSVVATTAVALLLPLTVDWLNRPAPVAADAVSVGRTGTSASENSGVWERTWKVRAGQQHIWQSVGVSGLPTARMVPDKREGPFVLHASLRLQQLDPGKVRVTHDVGGFKASVDVEAKLADLIREAEAEPMGSGYDAIQLCALDCAPLLLARMPPDTPLTNLGGISDEKPQPASAWYLHVWQTAPGNGRSVRTTRVFPNISHEHLSLALRPQDLLGKLTVKREPDGGLRYRADYYGFSGFVNTTFTGEIELDRLFIIGNPRDSRKGCAVLTHEPQPDKFTPVETWVFYPQKGTQATLVEWLRTNKLDVIPKVQWRPIESGVELTGAPQHVRPLVTALHCGDHASVSSFLQLPILNMPPDFFVKLTLGNLLTAQPFTEDVFAPALIETLTAAGVTPAHLAAALRRHVLDLSKMEIRNNLPPFESITRAPGASTTYDIAIPLGDEDETIHFSARKLTLRVERTTRQVGTRSRIVSLAPWLIEEAKQQPGTPVGDAGTASGAAKRFVVRVLFGLSETDPVLEADLASDGDFSGFRSVGDRLLSINGRLTPAEGGRFKGEIKIGDWSLDQKSKGNGLMSGCPLELEPGKPFNYATVISVLRSYTITLMEKPAGDGVEKCVSEAASANTPPTDVQLNLLQKTSKTSGAEPHEWRLVEVRVEKPGTLHLWVPGGARLSHAVAPIRDGYPLRVAFRLHGGERPALRYWIDGLPAKKEGIIELASRSLTYDAAARELRESRDPVGACLRGEPYDLTPLGDSALLMAVTDGTVPPAASAWFLHFFRPTYQTPPPLPAALALDTVPVRIGEMLAMPDGATGQDPHLSGRVSQRAGRFHVRLQYQRGISSVIVDDVLTPEIPYTRGMYVVVAGGISSVTLVLSRQKDMTPFLTNAAPAWGEVIQEPAHPTANRASTTLKQDAAKLAGGKVWQSDLVNLKSRDGVAIPNQRLVMEFAAATSDKHDARVKLELMSSITAPEAPPLSVSSSIGDAEHRDVHLREKDGIRTMKMVRSIETVARTNAKTARILDKHFSTLVRYELRHDRLILLDLPVDRPLDWGDCTFVMPQTSLTLRPTP